MDIFFWRRGKGKTEELDEEAVMEEIREIKKRAKQKELDEWSEKRKKEKKIIKKDIEKVIENLPTLPARCLKAAKKGKGSIKVMKLKGEHLSVNYNLEKLAYYDNHSFLSHYSKYIDDSDILNMISILEGKGLEVFIETDKKSYDEKMNIDDLEDSTCDFFNPNAYLSVSW